MKALLAWIRKLKQHDCSFEYRVDVDEEHHGLNPTKRFCKRCDKEQWLYVDRILHEKTWKDAPW